MTRTMNRGTQLILCVAALLPLLTPQLNAQRDSILRKNGKPKTKLTLLKLEQDKITYKQGGKEQTMAISLITDFRFGAAPEAFNRGQSAASRGSHLAAAKLFAEVSTSAKTDVIKSSAMFFAGRSFALAAKKDGAHATNAIAQLQAYVAAEPNGYYLPEAKVRMAQANLANGDAAGAETALVALDSEATAAGWPLFWGALIRFELAQAQFQQMKFGDARSSFQGVETAATAALGQDAKFNGQLASLRTEALVLQGETFIGAKLYDDALNYYQQLANNNTRGVKAAAQAGQGQILYIQGNDKKDEDKLRQAQIALARASVEPDTSDTTSAKALYYMGLVLQALGDKEQNSAGRAKTYFTSVKNVYATTPWAALARKALEG